MAATTRKSKSSKPPAVKRLTDEELATLIKQFVAKLPDAGQSAFVRQVRTAGRSVSGGRVRALWGKAASKAKPTTKRAA